MLSPELKAEIESLGHLDEVRILTVPLIASVHFRALGEILGGIKNHYNWIAVDAVAALENKGVPFLIKAVHDGKLDEFMKSDYVPDLFEDEYFDKGLLLMLDFYNMEEIGLPRLMYKGTPDTICLSEELINMVENIGDDPEMAQDIFDITSKLFSEVNIQNCQGMGHLLVILDNSRFNGKGLGLALHMIYHDMYLASKPEDFWKDQSDFGLGCQKIFQFTKGVVEALNESK